MSLLRRRFGVVENHDKPPPQANVAETSDSLNRQLLYSILLVIALSLFIYLINTTYLSSSSKNKPPVPFLTFSTSPDDELTLSNHRLPAEDMKPPNFHESAVVCMPTVKRLSVEYVSNSIKSFRLATRNSTQIRRLIVYAMDYPPTKPVWLNNVFNDAQSLTHLPTWLEIQPRRGAVTRPRKATFGDSWERVVWRSKEALDYAQALERCGLSTNAEWIIVVQDDVLFRSSITQVINWSSQNIVDRTTTVNNRRVARVCAGSLFDVADQPHPHDGDELRSSNMVARVWRRNDVQPWVHFFKERFDDAPVDWLADKRCRSRRGWVTVMWPNPVRHRGKVSSFSNNQREGLLT